MESLIFYGFFAVIFLFFQSSDTSEVEKRYLAALAKNGRLPKFANAQKKNSEEYSSLETSFPNGIKVDEYPKDSFNENKRHIGAFLNSRGKPSSQSIIGYDGSSNGESSEDFNTDDKRNVASLARLGRLNAIRYGRYHAYGVGEKRIKSEEDDNDAELSNNDEDNTISVLDDPDCYDTEDESLDSERQTRMEENSNWEKRYVAALARSGRLPIWHPQRMWWGGKRYDSKPYWADSTATSEGKNENSLDESAFLGPKSKKCKKYDYQMDKRNIGALARDGKLPMSFNGKRNVAALARDGKLRFTSSDKRNVAALARDGKLRMSSGDKRNIAALARNGKLRMSSGDKRNIAALARDGKLRMSSEDKRNIAALARDGKLPISSNDKRNIAALARDGKLPISPNA